MLPYKQFVAGKTAKDAIRITKAFNKKRIGTTIDIFLNEPKNTRTALSNAKQYTDLLSLIAKTKANATIALKLSQIGFFLDKHVCQQNLAMIAACAAEKKNSVTVDMEEHEYEKDTVRIFEETRKEFPNMMIALQAYLKGVNTDVKRLAKSNASIRLVKGTYNEPSSVVLKDHDKIDANFIKIAKVLLRTKQVHAFATHDEYLLDFIKKEAKKTGKKNIEFQTLYGFKPHLPQMLAKQGYYLRVYMPYGANWHGYVKRRLSELSSQR